jgi:integrase
MKDYIIFDVKDNRTSKYYSKLDKKSKEIVENFEKYLLLTAGEGRANKGKTNAIRFLVMANKPIDKLNLEDLRNYLLKLKQAPLSDYSKNDSKNFVHRFLKWYFKDWSKRFNEFEDIKYDHDAERKNKITSEDVLSKQDVELLIKKENNLYWKTFLIVQYEGALRTQEVRMLKWEDINTEDTDAYWLTIKSKKNKRGKEKTRLAPPLKDNVIYFLEELRKEQNPKSVYVFPSPLDPTLPTGAGAVNNWFSRLTERVLNRHLTNYLLRHSKGEEFHKLVRDNRLSKENALQMMGHTEEMFDKTYSHPDKKKLKEVLKKQVLDIDYIAPEKKHALELKIDQQGETIKKLEKNLEISSAQSERAIDLLEKLIKTGAIKKVEGWKSK